MIRFMLLATALYIFTGCTSYIYKKQYSEINKPEWYSKVDKVESCVILPFQGGNYLGSNIPLPKLIESKITSMVDYSQQLKLYSRFGEKLYLADDPFIGVNNLVDGLNFGETHDVDIVVTGRVSNFSSGEIFIESVDEDDYTADEYERYVTFDFDFNIYSVKNSNLVYQFSKTVRSESTGHKNVEYKPEEKRKKKEKKSGFMAFVDLMVTIFGGPYDLDSYETLQDRCVATFMDGFERKILKYRVIERVAYSKDSNGNLVHEHNSYGGITTRLDLVSDPLPEIKASTDSENSKKKEDKSFEYDF